MVTVIDKSFSLQINILRFVGLYPSKTHPTLQKVKGYILYFTLMVFVTILMFINVIHGEHSDITQTNVMMSFLTETAFCCFKLVPFLRYGERVENCINYFAHPRFLPKSDEERRIVKDCVQVCRRISYIYFNFLVVCSAAWILPFLLTNQLPADVWLPYDPTKGPMVYYTTAAFLTAACIYGSFPGPMLDPLYGGLAYYATSQLKILVYNLQNLQENTEQDKNQSDPIVRFENVSERLKQCVKHHNNIFEFVAEYEKCFSWSVFSQIASSLFGMCFASIGVIIAPVRSFDALKSVGFVCALILRIFFYCYYGTLLYEENKGFIDTICMSPWYNYDVKVSKLLILMMERSKRPMILTAGKIVNLTLQTFTSLLKTSYSLIAVLK